MAAMSRAKRVLIVGAGSSGLAAIKACLEEDQQPVCLEKTLDLGGLWNYSDGPSAPGTAGIYESLVINTCKEMMAFSDFPVPEDVPQFLTHANVLCYFRMYAVHFGLLPYIRFNTEVRHVRKADDYEETGRWVVTYVAHVNDACPMKCVNGDRSDVQRRKNVNVTSDDENDGRFCSDSPRGTPRQSGPPEAETSDSERRRREAEVRESGTCREVTEVFEGVMICSGHHTVPYMPSFPGIDLFRGELIHSQQYKRPSLFAGQRVLIIGIGNSAVDIASDLAKTAAKVYLSTRRGSWVVARTALWGIPADMVANSRVVFSLPTRLLQWCVELQANMRMDHDMLGLTPAHRLLGAHPTINDEIPFHLMSRRVEVRPNVTHFLPHQVHFQDGTTEEVDVVIMATGYDYRLDFLDPEVVQVRDNRVGLYKYVFPPRLPHATLAVIGLVQPIGAVMPIAELQTRWFLNLLLGRVKLPERAAMEKDIDRKQQNMDAKYYHSRRHTLQTFWIEHMDEVAEQFGARPDLFRMFLKDPGLALRCYLGPCLPAQYRLQGPKPWPHAAAYIKNVRARSSKRPHTTRDPCWDPNRGSGPEARGRTERIASQLVDKADGSRLEGGGAETRAENGANGTSKPSACRAAAFTPAATPRASLKWRRSWSSVLYYAYLVVMCVCCVFWLGSAVLGRRAGFRGDT